MTIIPQLTLEVSFRLCTIATPTEHSESALKCLLFRSEKVCTLKSLMYTVRMIVQASDTGLDSHGFSQTGRPAAANITFDFPTRATPV